MSLLLLFEHVDVSKPMGYNPEMTTTVNLSRKRQVVLPKEFCDRKKFGPGTALRVTEIRGGLYITAAPEPTEAQLRAVFAAVDGGQAPRRETARDEKMVADAIKKFRAAKANG
jgi:bifunctional DNA-binding transcriptional regulator/antitoxin component of YhaV-PrlF toxin-antitoxin module